MGLFFCPFEAVQRLTGWLSRRSRVFCQRKVWISWCTRLPRSNARLIHVWTSTAFYWRWWIKGSVDNRRDLRICPSFNERTEWGQADDCTEGIGCARDICFPDLWVEWHPHYHTFLSLHIELSLFYKEYDVAGKLFRCHCGQLLG